MRLTNAERGNLISALDDAILLMRSSIEGVTVDGKGSSAEDRENVREWRRSARLYRALRRKFRSVEKRALADFARERKATRRA